MYKNKVTIPFEQVYQYTSLSIRLLNALLGVDLHGLLLQPEVDAQERERQQAKLDAENQEIETKKIVIGKIRQKLEIIARNAVEKLSYQLVIPSFEIYFEQLSIEVQDKFRYSNESPNDRWQTTFNNMMSDYIKNELNLVEIASLVKKTTSASPVITDFYLDLLQYVVFNPKGIDFLGIYQLSRLYPEIDQRVGRDIVGGDAREPIYEYIFSTHADVLRGGDTWIEDLEYICRTIETWTRAPGMNWDHQ